MEYPKGGYSLDIFVQEKRRHVLHYLPEFNTEFLYNTSHFNERPIDNIECLVSS